MDRASLEPVVVAALKAHGGQASVMDVAKYIWKHHEADLRRTDFFYIWQYDMRRAAENLRNRGVLKPYDKAVGKWELA
jgi:hypothetical protein